MLLARHQEEAQRLKAGITKGETPRRSPKTEGRYRWSQKKKNSSACFTCVSKVYVVVDNVSLVVCDSFCVNSVCDLYTTVFWLGLLEFF